MSKSKAAPQTDDADPYDSEIDVTLRDAIAGAMAEADAEVDKDGLDQPLDETPIRETVSADEAGSMARDARSRRPRRPSADEDEDDPKGQDGEDDRGAENKNEGGDADRDRPAGDGGADTPAALGADASVADLLAEVPERVRAEVGRRLTEADAALAPLRTEAARADLARHGTSERDAIARLVQLNAFAQEATDEYLAWVAQEMGGRDKAADVLGKAAARLGLRVAPADAEDDAFADEETVALRRRVRELEQGRAAAFGPDTPERVARRNVDQELTAFVEARGEDGQLLRPHFRALGPQITAMAQAQVAQTGRLISTADLGALYDRAVQQMVAAFGGSSAQPRRPVVSPTQTAQAADAKMRRASKSIDGTGHGAPRRSAPAPDASLDEVLRFFSRGDD